MAYRVTKRIGNREYRYHVEGYRDPKTKRIKQKWTYLGRVAGNSVVAARHRSRDDVRARILGAVVQLLEKRDVSRVTIDVVIRSARVSRATFYRHFSGKTAVLNAAIASVYEDLLEIPIRVDEPIASAAVERARLRSWVEGLLRAVVQKPGILRAVFSSAPLRKEKDKRTRVNRAIVHRSLVTYMDRLSAAGLTQVDDPAVLAHGIMSANAGVVRQIVYDRIECPPELLIAGAAEIVCRAVFPERRS